MSSAEAKPSRKRGKGDAAAAATSSNEPIESSMSMEAPAHAHAPVSIEVKEATSVSTAIIGAVEAVIFSSERAITPARIAAAVFYSPSKKASEDDEEPKASAADQKTVEHAIETLNDQYERTGRAFRIESISGGYRVMTLPKFAEAVAAFKRVKQSSKLSKPAIETLAIVSYRQPITRAELEAIRGVACGEVLKSLVERKLVTITGRAEEVGRPMLYGTTKQFLDLFGLASIKDLPAPADFAKLTS